MNSVNGIFFVSHGPDQGYYYQTPYDNLFGGPYQTQEVAREAQGKYLETFDCEVCMSNIICTEHNDAHPMGEIVEFLECSNCQEPVDNIFTGGNTHMLTCYADQTWAYKAFGSYREQYPTVDEACEAFRTYCKEYYTAYYHKFSVNDPSDAYPHEWR